MPIFQFIMTRNITHSKVCQIEAPTIEEAHELACDGDSASETGWEDDDLPTPCKPYIPDENAYEIISEHKG
jgi:hypothetical protein